MAIWRALGLGMGVAAGLTALAARADYPTRPVTVIVAFGQGGGTDLLIRAFAPFLERHLGDGARVTVVNRPGAAGEIGFAALADSAPDGYTIGAINAPNVTAIPIERAARYALERLDPLYNLVEDPGGFAVPADSPIRSLFDLVARARAAPGAVTVGTTGIGSDDHLGLLMFQRRTGVALTHVPFHGAAANQAALANHAIAVSSVNAGEATRFQRKEPGILLGVMAQERLPQAPGVPTFAEQGYPVVMSSLRGIAAPRGLPPEVRAELVAALEAAANDPAFQEQAADLAQPLRLLPPDAYAAALADSTERLSALWTSDPWTGQDRRK